VGSVVYIRYKQIEAFFKGKNSTWMDGMNFGSMVLGMISTLGVLVIGAFQETNVVVMHLVGAFMSFLSAGIYLCFQVSPFTQCQNCMTSSFNLAKKKYLPPIGLLHFPNAPDRRK